MSRNEGVATRTVRSSLDIQAGEQHVPHKPGDTHVPEKGNGDTYGSVLNN